ncbi:sensor histidine kinase [Protaetiibacter sp. SSC-01]|uniref:sensor histidine kinase n=1 Tax=Protaetiibacter sp. SSC-01 TaxID=2759943 RepID=UPI001656D9CB|nr:histidine kinase [Protaetiibacter sp. SSC-01]QNO36651.1 sensor histidine kinase [Protaetiibacter sp. SSC-01]
MWRTLTRRQLAVDIAVPGVLFLFLLIPYSAQGLPSMLVLFGMSVALVLRRLSPGFSLAMAWITAIAQMLLGLSPTFANLAILAVLYATAAYGSRLVMWLGFASILVGSLTITFYVTAFDSLRTGDWSGWMTELLSGFGAAAFVSSLVSFGLSWSVGLLVRTLGRARQSRAVAIAANQEVAAEQERTRIARDMHDVVAHSLAVVVAQADGARYAARTDPAAAEEALRTIATTAREALADVRVLLAQLRYQQEDGPQPTLGDLDRLIEQLRASGLDVSREDSGEPLPLGTAQQIALYRIVQESLTNALRHADVSKPVAVRFSWTSHGVEASIVSHLVEAKTRTGIIPLAVPPVGHGIAGMTERAALGGGWLRADADETRFTVTAWLPYAPTGVHQPIVLEEPTA